MQALVEFPEVIQCSAITSMLAPSATRSLAKVAWLDGGGEGRNEHPC